MRFLCLILVATLVPLPSDSWNSLLKTHCSNTRFGCCSDGITAAANLEMSNCPKIRLIGGCSGTQFGCCKDGSFAKDLEKSNCNDSLLKSYESILIGEQSIGSNSNHSLYSGEQTNSLILIALGGGLFSIVLFSIVLLLMSAVVIIVCRTVKQKRARKLRIMLECDDDTGVEMGSPLMAEEFGVNLSI